MPAAPSDVRTTTEQWFLARGLPHFIEDYRADRDVFTRALPALGVILLLQLTFAADLRWRWWQNTLALVAAALAVLGALLIVNRLRGRSALQLPDRVGRVELGLFLVLPALVVFAVHRSAVDAGLEVVSSLIILGIVYLIVSYGIIPMIRWAIGQMARQLGSVIGLAGRALPLMLLISITLFVTADFWQVAASLRPGRLTAALAFLGIVALGFLLARLPTEVAKLRGEMKDETVRSAAIGTPVAASLTGLPGALHAAPLSGRERGNVLLVLLFTQVVQVVLVGLINAAFFLVFGFVVIRPEVITSWLGANIHTTALHLHLFGWALDVSHALIRVCALLGGVAAFYFAIYVITDSTYRAEFFEEILGQVRQSIAVRTVYLSLPREPGGDRAG